MIPSSRVSNVVERAQNWRTQIPAVFDFPTVDSHCTSNPKALSMAKLEKLAQSGGLVP
jgi:hypothetical protein